MTQLVTPKLVANVRLIVVVQVALTFVTLVVAGAAVILLLRVQGTQDDTARVLNDTVAAVRTGSPAAATTRNQIGAMCATFLADECPRTPAPGDPFSPPPTTPGQR